MQRRSDSCSTPSPERSGSTSSPCRVPVARPRRSCCALFTVPVSVSREAGPSSTRARRWQRPHRLDPLLIALKMIPSNSKIASISTTPPTVRSRSRSRSQTPSRSRSRSRSVLRNRRPDPCSVAPSPGPVRSVRRSPPDLRRTPVRPGATLVPDLVAEPVPGPAPRLGGPLRRRCVGTARRSIA